MQRLFDLTVEFTRNRKAFGTRIIDFQNSQFKLADIKPQIMVARAFIDQRFAKAQLMNSGLTPVESSVAKLTCSDLEFNAADQCLQLPGGMGYAPEMAISQIWTQARVHPILLGTLEIHRMAIERI